MVCSYCRRPSLLLSTLVYEALLRFTEKKNILRLFYGKNSWISSTLSIGCSWDMYLLKFSHYKSEGWFSFTQMFQSILGIMNSRLIMFAKRSEKLQIPHLTSSMRPTGFFFLIHSFYRPVLDCEFCITLS